MSSNKLKRNCDYCGKEYLAREYNVKKRGYGFCSVDCANKGKFRRDQFGKNNPNWKGGISKNNYHYKKLQSLRYPDHLMARNITHRAIKSGAIIKQPCEVCGSIIVHAHHDDYSKPLDVRWLCRKHHRELHDGLH